MDQDSEGRKSGSTCTVQTRTPKEGLLIRGNFTVKQKCIIRHNIVLWQFFITCETMKIALPECHYQCIILEHFSFIKNINVLG